MCPLCFWNDIGNEKHYSFHCTNPTLVEICKTFIGLIMYERFTPFPDINSVNDILHIILRRSPRMNCNRIGKFLSSVLVKTQHLYIEVMKKKMKNFKKSKTKTSKAKTSKTKTPEYFSEESFVFMFFLTVYFTCQCGMSKRC